MLNQQALDSLYSATYLEDYLDCMENLPDDIQRYISRMRDLDIEYSGYMQELESTMETWIKDNPWPRVKTEQTDDPAKLEKMYLDNAKKNDLRRQTLIEAQKFLMKAQDIGDEKLQLAQNVQDNIENKSRQLELDKKNLGELTKLRPREYGRELENQENTKEYATPDRGIKRQRRAKHEVFVPSILGPSTLEVTSFVDSNSHETQSLPSSAKNAKSKCLDIDVEPAATFSMTSTASSVYIKQEPKAGTSSHTEDNRFSGRGTDRTSTTSTRGGGGDSGSSYVKVEPGLANQGRNSERSSTAASTTSATPKKQSQKPQTNEKKQKRRRAKQARNNVASPPDPIDPDEPTYCLCDQVSYGEMIGCDNDLCPIEWFHFSCVSLGNKPKGKWYCPKCRGDKPNIMKSKALFLKELEKYNREKEEKA